MAIHEAMKRMAVLPLATAAPLLTAPDPLPLAVEAPHCDAVDVVAVLVVPFVADKDVSFPALKPTALIIAWKPDAIAPPNDDEPFPAVVAVDCDGATDAELFGTVVSGRGGGETWAVTPDVVEAVPIDGGVLLDAPVLLDVPVAPEDAWLGFPWLPAPRPLVPPPKPTPPAVLVWPEPLAAEAA